MKLPFYENVFIARQDISAPQVDSLADDFSKIIEDQGGKVAKREYWGLRTLAYRIKKNRKAHYVLLNIDAPTQAVQDMERQMRLNEDVLRYLTVRVDELEEGPSAMMQSRGGRDGRPRRDEPFAAEKRIRAEKGTDRPAKREAPGVETGDKRPAVTDDASADKAGDDAAGKAKAKGTGRGAAARKKPGKGDGATKQSKKAASGDEDAAKGGGR